MDECHAVLSSLLSTFRFLIGERTDPAALYEIADRIEYLPTLLDGSPEGYREYAEGVAAVADLHPLFRSAAVKAAAVAARFDGAPHTKWVDAVPAPAA